MGQHSHVRRVLMAVCAYLAMGVALAQSGPPAVTLQQAQQGAVAGMTDCQAVLAVTHGITRYLGADELARQLAILPTRLNALMSLTPESLREFFYALVDD